MIDKIRLIFLLIVGIFIGTTLISCDYDRAPFYYGDIPPRAPTGVSIIATNSTSATIDWTISDSSAYPSPRFNVYTSINNNTNLVTTVSNTSQAEISGLSSSMTYSAWVQATNRAGAANSATVTFTTP